MGWPDAYGTVDRAAVYPRRVIEAALKRGAAAIVLAHNHPNGEVVPGEHDKTLTRAIVLAAETVHLRVLDHLKWRTQASATPTTTCSVMMEARRRESVMRAA